MGMARAVSFGFFKRAGACLVGSIGKLSASWDRHRGGVQTITAAHRGAAPITIASRLKVIKEDKSILIRQEADPDPRLIICEEGPERIALRVMYSLIDEAGTYHGDGLTETTLWANGEVQLAFGLRLVDALAHDRVRDAWIEATMQGKLAGAQFGTRAHNHLSAAELQTAQSFRFRQGLPGRYIILERQREALAFSWYSADGRPEDELGGVGLWHGPRVRSPYYDTWGHLYGQWRSLSGWAVHKSSRLTMETDGGATRLGWHWLHGADEPCGGTFALRALLGLFFDTRAEHVRQRIKAFQKPLLPKCEGAQFRCLDVLENVLLYKKTDEVVKLTFPRDALKRTVHVRIFDLEGKGGVMVKSGGREVLPHLLSLGGITDDPYAPNLARPGDRFVPIIGNLDKGPTEVVFSVKLSSQKRTVASFREGPGIHLAYLKWDDREIYVIRASKMGEGALAAFSTRTLALHDLCKPGEQKPALVRVPFYWYPMNVYTRGHCLNELESLKVSRNGPEKLAFEIVSTNPNRRARSTFRIEIPSPDKATTVRALAQLEVLDRLDVEEMQYLNSFSSDSWQPRDWPGDWTLVMDSRGRLMQQFFKEPRGRWRMGTDISPWREKLAFIQGAQSWGNIFVLVENRKPADQQHGYLLCPLWLDSHFKIEGLKPPLEPGASFEVTYTLGVFGNQSLSRAEAIELARVALETGKLPLD